MLIDNLYNLAMFKGKSVSVDIAIFPNGPQNEPVDLATATQNFQNKLSVSQEEILESVNDANNVIHNAAHGDEELYEQNKLTLRSEKERIEALKIKTDAIKAYVKSIYVQAANLLPDDHNHRYFCAHCMKNELPLTDADKLYNERLAYLINKAETGAYKDLDAKKPLPPLPNEEGYVAKMREYDEKMKDYAKLLQEKNQLMQAHVDMFKKLKKSDVNKVMNHNYTDRELADEFELFNETAAITGQIENARNTTEIWFGTGKGIDSNSEIKDILNVYEPMTSTYTYYKQRLGALISPTYEYLDPIKNSVSLQTLSNANEEDAITGEAAKDATLIQEHKDAIDTSIMEDVFKLAGMPYTNLYFVTDDQEVNEHNGKRLSSSNYAEAKNKLLTVYDPGNPNITMKFHSKDFPKILKGLTEGKSLEELFPAPQPPKPVSWFGKVTDWFNDKLYGTKPNQEAYEKEMAEYNIRQQIREQVPVFKQLAHDKVEQDRIKAEQLAQNNNPQVEQNQANIQNQGPQIEEKQENIQNNAPKIEENQANIINQNNLPPQNNNIINENPKNENIINVENSIQNEINILNDSIKQNSEVLSDINDTLNKNEQIIGEVNNTLNKVSEQAKEYNLNINQGTQYENMYNDALDRFSKYLKSSTKSNQVSSMKKNIASLLYVTQINNKLEDSAGTEQFNNVYDKACSSLATDNILNKANEIMQSKAFEPFYGTLDPKLTEQMMNPKTAEKASKKALKEYVKYSKALEQQKENKVHKNKKDEIDNPVLGNDNFIKH